MKIIYFGEIHSTDSDFPLVRALQQKGHEVYYLIPLVDRFKRAGIIDLKSIKDKPGLFKGTDFEELKVYENYIDLSHLYMINFPKEGKKHISTWIAFVKTMIFVKNIHADVMHLVWPLSWLWTFLYNFQIPKIQVVHDPIRHSNITSVRDEKWRKRAFKTCDRLVMLNEAQKEEFQSLYNIDPQKISINHMGDFDYIRETISGERLIKEKYILFFGQIFSYKGLEYLCRAMVEVHKAEPDIKLVIAGKGELYFDFSPYKDLNYIILFNEYISLPRLANLLTNSEFCVCPYNDATQSGVIMTAFSAGTPAVVTNVGALPDMVKDNEYGLVIPPKNVEQLSNAILNLLRNDSKLCGLKSNIVNKWQKSMSWSTIAEKYIKDYNLIISQYGKSNKD